jgi:hypothetical protein
MAPGAMLANTMEPGMRELTVSLWQTIQVELKTFLPISFMESGGGASLSLLTQLLFSGVVTFSPLPMFLPVAKTKTPKTANNKIRIRILFLIV